MTLVYGLALLAVGLWVMRPEQPERGERAAGPISAWDLAGLVTVTSDLVLVSPRDVELPYSPLWALEDIMDTLVEIDAL